MKQDAIALLDWDNTLRPGFTVPDWTEFLTARQLFDADCHRNISKTFSEYAQGTATYANLAHAAAELYAKGIKGQQIDEIGASARLFASSDQHKLFSFTKPFVDTLKAFNLKIFVVSGCPEDVLVAYQSLLGLDGVHGIEVETQDGYYLDAIRLDTAGQDGKRTIVSNFAASMEVQVAAGDSESDQALFERATISIVVDNPDLQPKSTVVQHWTSSQSTESLMTSLREAFLNASEVADDH